ncbi:hypothetical protein M3202_18500 [Alkalihalobacillus oceani]|uniref:Uncharacterized protein n=1 Tax=Halalkalibacter oceani TaxID=1653776 RepID=A0A9X2IQN5_9BACI|nr:hypothetical protein [Halalkalibacter oceani]MCM3716046.1 hypothetical protein [Halalkalibacter oceani]
MARKPGRLIKTDRRPLVSFRTDKLEDKLFHYFVDLANDHPDGPRGVIFEMIKERYMREQGADPKQKTVDEILPQIVTAFEQVLVHQLQLLEYKIKDQLQSTTSVIPVRVASSQKEKADEIQLTQENFKGKKENKIDPSLFSVFD